jgi:hypothetical protein
MKKSSQKGKLAVLTRCSPCSQTPISLSGTKKEALKMQNKEDYNIMH